MSLIIQRSKSEEDLIRGCRKGKSQSQRQLYEKYAGKMLTACRRYIKDASEAEEVMIGGFVKVFQKIDQFKSEGSFEGWVRRIMINESLIYLRKNKRMYLEIDIDDVVKEPDYDTLGNTLEAEDLLQVILKLPVGYRTVFNLYAIEGYSHKEIAEQLGINVNTSKSQLSRARKMIQKFLSEIESWENERIKQNESYERVSV